ncbi:MAG: hypothetical protein Q9181_006818 [Wetmoreana brouardii]
MAPTMRLTIVWLAMLIGFIYSRAIPVAFDRTVTGNFMAHNTPQKLPAPGYFISRPGKKEANSYLLKRQNGSEGSVTIFENGHFTDPKYAERFTCHPPNTVGGNNNPPLKPVPSSPYSPKVAGQAKNPTSQIPLHNPPSPSPPKLGSARLPSDISPKGKGQQRLQPAAADVRYQVYAGDVAEGGGGGGTEVASTERERARHGEQAVG